MKPHCDHCQDTGKKPGSDYLDCCRCAVVDLRIALKLQDDVAWQTFLMGFDYAMSAVIGVRKAVEALPDNLYREGAMSALQAVIDAVELGSRNASEVTG